METSKSRVRLSLTLMTDAKVWRQTKKNKYLRPCSRKKTLNVRDDDFCFCPNSISIIRGFYTLFFSLRAS